MGMDAMRSALGAALNEPIELSSQMRVKGGRAYLDYVRSILDAEDPELEVFDRYDFVLHEDFSDFVDSFERDYGKNTATLEELDLYIKNLYYVLLTRGILGTHVYAVNLEMRAYLSKYFPQSA